MSQENVELVRRFTDAINRRDFDAAYENTAEDLEADLTRAVGIDQGMYNAAQTRRLTEDFASSWDTSEYAVDEWIEVDEHVVTPVTNRLRGRGGVEVEARVVWVWTIREGQIARVCLFQGREEALEAAGLRE